MSEERKQTAWAALVSQLTPAARQAVRAREPRPLDPGRTPPRGSAENEDYALWQGQLSPAAREALDQAAARPEDESEVPVDHSQARYCLVEIMDGEWPLTRLFRTAEGLAQRIGQLDGEDVVVSAFLGVPLRFTKGPQRYLLLPDGSSALAVPPAKGVPVRAVDADAALAEADLQEDGFLGSDSLANTPILARKRAAALGQPLPKDEEDEDDDEDGED